MLRKRTTGPGGSGPLGRSERPVKEQDPPEWKITPARLSRAAFELAREHRQIDHLPTRAQWRTMARLAHDQGAFFVGAGFNAFGIASNVPPR